MRRKLFSIVTALTCALAAAGCASSDAPERAAQTTPASNTAASSQSADNAATAKQGASTSGAATANDASAAAHDAHAHGGAAGADEVPAFEVSEASLKHLPPTLPASMFTGKTQQAYRAAAEIPQTIAQLPCYCHCDKGFGHKSLHSCYVDNHASMCAVCVDEALTAYRLQTEQHLKPAEIRERIIAVYSAQGF